MRLQVLGGCGGWPAAGQACSGYLLEHDGYWTLVDPGYATLPRLLELVGAEAIDAVLVSHGHADHCADLHPLMRARALRDDPLPPLPIHALPGALDRVLALDRPGMLDDAYQLIPFEAGDSFSVGPFEVSSWALPHFLPNAGLRIAFGGRVLAYTGDTGPSRELIDLARDADVYLAEATFAYKVPADSEGHLSSARYAGQVAARTGIGTLVLTHLWPGTDPSEAEEQAGRSFTGEIAVARAGLVVDLERPSVPDPDAADAGRKERR
jgi:ribonuclease BN (tRNA processing enzyme)